MPFPTTPPAETQPLLQGVALMPPSPGKLLGLLLLEATSAPLQLGFVGASGAASLIKGFL